MLRDCPGKSMMGNEDLVTVMFKDAVTVLEVVIGHIPKKIGTKSIEICVTRTVWGLLRRSRATWGLEAAREGIRYTLGTVYCDTVSLDKHKLNKLDGEVHLKPAFPGVSNTALNT